MPRPSPRAATWASRYTISEHRQGAVGVAPFAKSLNVLFLLAAALAVSGPVRGHSFALALMAPLSGPHAAAGRELLDGVRLAARERDAHPGETADGHLGGLDLYLYPIDTAAGTAAVMRRLEALLGQPAGLDLLAGEAPSGAGAAIATRLRASRAVRVPDPLPAQRRTQDGVAFEAAFEQHFGYRPAAPAVAGYAIARRVDRAVRALGGEFSDRAALERALRE